MKARIDTEDVGTEDETLIERRSQYKRKKSGRRHFNRSQ